jgi:predicted HAD superfamily Cof-like phosphohydrolase
MTPAEMVREFHEAFGVPLPCFPGIPGGDVEALRFELLREEYQELTDALATGDLAAIAKEAADLVYVTLGLSLAYGIDPDPVFAAVHESNLSKLGDDGLPVYREDGKVTKGPHYVEPDIAGVLGIEAP